MSTETRPYRKKQRAALEAETRQRITESAVALHGTLGPARTSISAIAEHAGVRRSTVYRHFPDDTALFAACSAHWRAENPPPDLERWAAVADADERLRSGLAELYAFYGRTEQMLGNLLRDEHTVPAVGRTFTRFRGYLDAARDTLMAGRPDSARTRAAIGHALTFPAWRSLVREQGLADAEAVELMCRLVASA
jgi:AcrR family transcriptional regulator